LPCLALPSHAKPRPEYEFPLKIKGELPCLALPRLAKPCLAMPRLASPSRATPCQALNMNPHKNKGGV